MSELTDETAYLQVGQNAVKQFYSMRFGDKVFSNWNKWPNAENPKHKYKIASMILHFSQNMVAIERSTYSGLEWLGDIGGLFEGLSAVGWALVGPLAAYTLR